MAKPKTYTLCPEGVRDLGPIKSLNPQNVAALEQLHKDRLQYLKDKGEKQLVKKMTIGRGDEYVDASQLAGLGLRAHEQYKGISDNLIRLFSEEPAMRKIFNNKSYRARIVGHTYLVVLQNCIGTKLERAEAILNEVGGFDYENEVVSARNWPLPLSGSLYNDVRANYIANKVAEMTEDNALSLFQRILNAVVEQVEDSALSNGKVRVVLPVFFAFEDDINNYKEEILPNGFLSHLKNLNPSFSLAKNEKSILETTQFLSEMGKGETFAYAGSLAGIISGTAAIAGYDTRLVAPDSATTGLYEPVVLTKLDNQRFDEKLREKEMEEFKATEMRDRWDLRRERYEVIRNQISYCLADTYAASVLAPLCDRERLEWDTLRKAILKRRKEEKNAASKPPVTKASQSSDESKEIKRLKEELAKERAKNEELKALAEKASTEAHHKDIKAKKLETQLTAAERERDHLKAYCEKLETERKELKAAAHNETEAAAVAEADPNLDTSVFDDKRIVVFGGHPSWVNGMKGLHPNVTFYGNETSHIPESAIPCADMVWFQVNAMQHSDYNRLNDVAQSYNKPVMYISYAGHGKARRQMVEETKKYFTDN